MRVVFIGVAFLNEHQPNRTCAVVDPKRVSHHRHPLTQDPRLLGPRLQGRPGDWSHNMTLGRLEWWSGGWLECRIQSAECRMKSPAQGFRPSDRASTWV